MSAVRPGPNDFPSDKGHSWDANRYTANEPPAARDPSTRDTDKQVPAGRVRRSTGVQFPFLADFLRKSLGRRAASGTSTNSSLSSQTRLDRQNSFSSTEQQVGRGLKTLDLRSLPREDGPPTELQARREKFAYFEKKCSEVAPGICLGGELVARDKAILQEHGVTHVVNCVGMVCPACFPEDFTYLTLYLNDATSEDMVSLLYDIFTFIEEALEAGGKVLVHCSQGVSRSATFVIAFLMWKHNQPYDKAYQAVKAIRGVTNPNIGFTCQLLNWAKRRNGARLPTRAYQIAPHSEDTKYPVYLVARPLPDVSPSIMDPAKALLLRLPQTTYIWQGSQCPQEHVQAARRAASGFQRYENIPPPTLVHQGCEPLELLRALGVDHAALTAGPQPGGNLVQHRTPPNIPQVKLATLAPLAGPNSGRGEGSAPSSARSKTPRDEASQGPLGLRSPNQRQRKVRRSDSTSEGPATTRSRSSDSIDGVDDFGMEAIAKTTVELSVSSPRLRTPRSARGSPKSHGSPSPLSGSSYRRSPRKKPFSAGRPS